MEKKLARKSKDNFEIIRKQLGLCQNRKYVVFGIIEKCQKQMLLAEKKEVNQYLIIYYNSLKILITIYIIYKLFRCLHANQTLADVIQISNNDDHEEKVVEELIEISVSDDREENVLSNDELEEMEKIIFEKR